ncbi:MAG: ribosomal protein methyltransferase [Bacteroidota bacterium]
MNYIEVKFQINPVIPYRDVLTVYLADIDFESFVEEEDGLTAYIQKDAWDENRMALIIENWNVENCEVNYQWKEIAQQNWNAQWESQFEPIEVSDDCRVCAPFHDKTNVPFELIIEPKMSFGTGHHATTHLMLSEMLTMDFTDKKVLDMGSGTGVLAILAEKKGASSLDAIDIDEWAFENCNENALRNNCSKIQSIQGGAEKINQRYDIILANINRNILTRDGSIYWEHLVAGGHLLLSGFYEQDVPILMKAFPSGKPIQQTVKEGWCMLHLTKS